MKRAILFLLLGTLTAQAQYLPRPDTGGGDPASVSDVAYNAATWNAVVDIAPSKNVVRDKFETTQPLDADLTTWAGVTPGTGVATALAVNVGSAGAVVVNGGALGTPASGVASSLTIDASGFDGNLTTSDNTLQEVAQKLDDLTAAGGFTAADITGAADIDAFASGDSFVIYDLSGTALKEVTGTQIKAWIDAGDHAFTGAITLGPMSGDIVFEGATADAFETSIAVVDPTTDRTFTLPNKTGTAALQAIATLIVAGAETIGATDPAEAYGGVIYVDTGGGTIAAPPVQNGMSFTVIALSADLVRLNPDDADLIILDGTALSDGDQAESTSTAGDMIVCTALGDGTGWYCASGSNDGDPWTDGN